MIKECEDLVFELDENLADFESKTENNFKVADKAI